MKQFRVSSCWVFIANTFFLTTPAVSFAKHDVSAGLPQPFSSKQQKKKMPTFLNLLVLFLELSGRCGASSRRSYGNVTFGVDVGVLCIKRSVSWVTKKHENGRSTKKKGTFSPLHPYTHRTQRLVWVPWCDSRNRASQYQIEAASWQRKADRMRAE